MAYRFAFVAPWRRPIAALIAASALFAPATALTETPEPPRVMIVLDGSGSMWGQIADGHKIVLARKALGAIFREHDKALSLGLVAYGHRKSSGCDDIETLAALETLNAEAYAARVDAIKPKGSTPIGGALRHAAKAGGAEAQKLDIVLIADGLDNCRADPCAIAGELEQASTDLRIHVVAFAEPENDLQKLSCIAENTGGAFSRAQDAVGLASALSAAFRTILAPPAEAAQVAENADPAPVGSIAEEEGSVDDAELLALESFDSDEAALTVADGPRLAQAGAPSDASPAAAGATPVSFKALVTEAGPTIESGLVWRVFDPQRAADGGYRLISTHREAQLATSLPPGEYLINAAYGLSNLTKKIKIEPGKPIEDSFILNTGGLKLGAALANGEAIVGDAIRYDIFLDETDQFGNREKLLEDAKPNVMLRLNSGVYHIVSSYGDANAIVRADVTIEPGKLTEATINHAAAQVTFKLVAEPGGEALADTQWSVTSSGGDVIKESAGALPTHILAAGDYTVAAKHGGLTYSRPFKVESGKSAQVEVVMK